MILDGNKCSEITLLTSVFHYINHNSYYKRETWWVVVGRIFSLTEPAAKDLCKLFNINPEGKIK